MAAHPQASRAGIDVLERGGDAIDAAIAVQAMLGLVEPQSSGIGGGAFLLYYDAQTGEITAYNGREKAPAAARPDMLLDADGVPLPRSRAMLGGRATGVPGVLALLERAHSEHGTLAWEASFEPAIVRAERLIFLVAPRAEFITIKATNVTPVISSQIVAGPIAETFSAPRPQPDHFRSSA